MPPTELIVVRPYDDGPTARLRETGVAVISQPDLRWKRCDVKSTNLLANVLANEAAHRAGCYEAVLVDDDGLRHRGDALLAPLGPRAAGSRGRPKGPGSCPGRPGSSSSGSPTDDRHPVRRGRVTLDELIAADEVILLGTTIEVLPVVRSTAAGRRRRARPGRPRLQAAYREAVERWLAPQPV